MLSGKGYHEVFMCMDLPSVIFSFDLLDNFRRDNRLFSSRGKSFSLKLSVLLAS